MDESSRQPVCSFDPEKLALRLDATIRGEVAAVPPLVDQIMSLVTEIGCAQGQEFEIRLAVSEALNNAVEHGCGNDPAKRVEVAVECDPERGMLIVVRDPGPGFDPSSIPSPVEGERIFLGGGRGIFLINQLMDHVKYERGGTEIRMVKRDAGPKVKGGGGGESEELGVRSEE